MLGRPQHTHSAGLCPGSSQGGGSICPSHLRGLAWCLLGPGAWPRRPLGPIQQVERHNELGFQLDTGACSHSISQVRAPNAGVPETQVSLLPVWRTQNLGV